MYKYFPNEVLMYLGQKIKSLLQLKYDKTGGEISGDVKIDGSLTFDIDDLDYDAGVVVTNSITNANGTVMYLEGYIDSSGHTSYRPVIRNIGNPTQDYDAVNKKYVDDLVMLDDIYLVGLDSSGNINSVTSTLTYDVVKSEINNRTKNVYLDILWEPSRCYVKAVEDADTNNGPIQFIGDIHRASVWRHVEFNLYPNDTLTVSMQVPELQVNKTTDIISNYNSSVLYPTTSAVYDQFIRKPEVIWQTDGSTGLLALETDLTANPAWQLTGLDFSPYTYIKIYAKGGKSATDASNEPSKIIEMNLDPISANAGYGHYVGTIMFQNFNDRNRIGTIACVVSSDKTKFLVLRMTSLYGTAASSNNGTNSYVYKIKGYFD